jgi:tRNA pseudouridine38-40 synthase
MRNVRALIAYDGSTHFGWQRQEGFQSVQENIEAVLADLTGESVVVHGAGRTDTGVHALGQVASFRVNTRLCDDRLRHALNAHLDRTIVVRRLETCAADFHARFDARAKRYMYLVLTTRFPPPFPRQYAHWTTETLNAQAMRQAAAQLIGRRDFSALASSGSTRRSNVRTLSAVRILARRERFAVIAQADGFLYNMMRALVGTLLEVGRGKLAVEDMGRILASRDRRLAGPTAPAHGLYLLRVLYRETCFRGPDRGPRGAPGLFAL